MTGTATATFPPLALSVLRSDDAVVELEPFVTPGARWDAFVGGLKDIMDGLNDQFRRLQNPGS